MKQSIVCVCIPMIILNMDTTVLPNDGFVNINDQMHITGIIAKLYVSKIRNIAVNSIGLFNCLCWPKISVRIIRKTMIVLVIKSHRIETPQKMCTFTPLTYCMNFALHCFSYSKWDKWRIFLGLANYKVTKEYSNDVLMRWLQYNTYFDIKWC